MNYGVFILILVDCNHKGTVIFGILFLSGFQIVQVDRLGTGYTVDFEGVTQ